jgi:hypothetical protein
MPDPFPPPVAPRWKFSPPLTALEIANIRAVQRETPALLDRTETVISAVSRPNSPILWTAQL